MKLHDAGRAVMVTCLDGCEWAEIIEPLRDETISAFAVRVHEQAASALRSHHLEAHRLLAAGQRGDGDYTVRVEVRPGDWVPVPNLTREQARAEISAARDAGRAFDVTYPEGAPTGLLEEAW